MRSRKRKVTLQGFGSRFTRTPEQAKAQGVVDGRTAWQQEIDAERERAEAPLKAIIAQTSAAVAATQKVIGSYWSQSIETIQSDCQQNEAAVDTLFTVPALRDSFTVEDMQSAFQEWFDNDMPKSPYTLSHSGQGGPRLFLFGLVAARRLGLDLSNPAAWQSAFDRVREVDAFQPGEVLFDSSKVAAEPEPAPVLSERDQVTADFYAAAFPHYQGWLESLKRNFNGFTPDEETLKYIFGTSTTSRNPADRGWFWNHNESPHNPAAYDRCRRFLVATNVWSRDLLTADETLSQVIEADSTPLDHMTRADRFDLLNSLGQLQRKS